MSEEQERYAVEIALFEIQDYDDFDQVIETLNEIKGRIQAEDLFEVRFELGNSGAHDWLSPYCKVVARRWENEADIKERKRKEAWEKEKRRLQYLEMKKEFEG